MPHCGASPTIGNNSRQQRADHGAAGTADDQAGLGRADQIGGLQHVGRMQAGKVHIVARDEVHVGLVDAREQ
jgi:hypothetical protein